MSMTGGTITGTAGPPVFNVSGTLTVNTGTSTITNATLSITGATTISGTLTFSSTGGTKTFGDLTINGTLNNSIGESVTLSGSLAVNGTLTAGTGAYNLTGNNKTVSGITTFTIPSINCTGSYTSSAAVTVSTSLSGNGTWINGNGSSLNISGNSTINNLDATAAVNTVTYDGSGTQTVASGTYYNLTINKPAGTASDNGVLTITNQLSVTSGIFSISNHTFTVSGGTLINGGTLTFTSPAGSKTLGDLTMSSGTWNAAVSRNFTFTGNLAFNGGTFTANTGTYILSGTSKTVSGTVSIPVVSCSGSYTNNGTVTITSQLSGAGSWTQGSSGILNLGLVTTNFTVSAFSASAASNTVNYTLAGAQNVRNVVYYHLGIAGTGIKTLTANTSILGNLSISSTLDVSTSNYSITLAGNWSSTGTFVPRTGTVTFNGTAPQTIFRAAGETFNTLTFTNPGLKTLLSDIAANAILTIASGATLDAGSPGFNITAKQSFTNNGTFIAEAGTVTLGGTSAQAINGTTSTTFYNLTLNNSAGGSIAINTQLSNTLTISNGTFTTTGFTFTLLSDAARTARIAAIPASGNFAGNITMQRYINSTVTSWRLIAAPVTGRTIADWNDDFVMSGFPGSNYPSMSFCSIYTYDETKPYHRDTGWTKPTSITNAAPPTKGFLAYIGPVPITMDVTGPPAKFAQSYTLTYTNNSIASNIGWNLVTNPYPSSIDWDASSGWTKTRLNNAIYIWNPDLQQYASYVAGIGTNGGTNIIPSSQAFFVQANSANPGLSLTENVKSATDQGFMKVMQLSQPIYNLTLGLKNNTYTDQTTIRFDANATWNFDGDYDAYKFPGGPNTPYLATVPDTNGDLSINSVPALDSTVVIPVRVKVGTTGTYTLYRDSITNLPSSSCIILEDLLTGTQTDLQSYTSYTFSISDTTSAPRFLIHIGAPIIKTSISASCNGSSNGAAIALGAGPGPWTYVWKDSSGTILRTATNVTGSDTLANALAGIYTVEVTDANSICGTVRDTFRLLQPAPLALNAQVADVTCYGMNDGAISLMPAGGTAPYSYSWSTGASSSFINALVPSSYAVVTTDSRGCTYGANYTISEPLPVIASFIESNDTAFLSQSGAISFTNTSTGASQYQWNFNDSTMLNTTADVVHYYDSIGTYMVEMVASSGSCSDTAYFSIVVVNDTAQVTSGQPENALGNGTTAYAAGGSVIVSFDLDARTCVEIELLDELGRDVMDKQRACVEQETLRFALPGLARGVYILRVNSDSGQYARKIIF
jgi:hypothetical protein